MTHPLARVLLAALLSAPFVSQRAASAPLSPAPAPLHAGQRAVVHTVFAGADIDSFEAEIVGTLSNGRTQGDMIVARATSARVIHEGIAQGMSGSPVYVDGRLIGALSSGWAFSRDPLFGITPIGEMLELWNRPASDTSDTESAGPSGADEGGTARPPRFREMRWAGDDDDDGADGAPAVPAPAMAPGLSRLPLPLACSGLDPRAAELARNWFAPLGLTAVPGGRVPAGREGPATLEPGSAVAIEVMRGDLQLAAIGTVTWRDGDRVLIFGHPFFQSGRVRMPMATADIVTVVASQQMSFKLGQRGREVGAVIEDRRSGVAGRIGAVANMLPVNVDVGGTAPSMERFRFETIQDRNLAPMLVSIAAMNSWLESGGSAANQTLRWTLRLYRPRATPLELRDVVVGEAPPSEVATALAGPLRFLFSNPFAPLALDSIGVTIVAAPGRDAWSLRSARLVEPTVRPGGTAHVSCEIEHWRGPRTTRVVTVTVPEEAPDGRYVLWVGGAVELTRYESTRLPGRYRATSLDDAWNRLARTRDSDALYAALYARAPEVNLEGRDYPELPASALPLLGGDQAAADRTRRGDVAVLDEQRLPVDGRLVGELTLNVVVDSSAPLAQP